MKLERVSWKRLIVDELLLWGAVVAIAVVLLLLMDAHTLQLRLLLLILLTIAFLGSFVYLPLLWRGSGWKLTRHVLYLRKGFWIRRRYEIPLRQIVSVMLVQNPVTPILKIASLVVVCPGFQVRIWGINAAYAKWLMKQFPPYVNDSTEAV